MKKHIQKQDIVKLLAEKMKTDEETSRLWVDTFLEILTEFIKKGSCITLKNFGGFYVKPNDKETWTFKFNPSQKLRYFLRWTSTYKGK